MWLSPGAANSPRAAGGPRQGFSVWFKRDKKQDPSRVKARSGTRSRESFAEAGVGSCESFPRGGKSIKKSERSRSQPAAPTSQPKITPGGESPDLISPPWVRNHPARLRAPRRREAFAARPVARSGGRPGGPRPEPEQRAELPRVPQTSGVSRGCECACVGGRVGALKIIIQKKK